MITGAKNWTSRIDESDLALVLARTSKKADQKTADKTRGLTLFLVDPRQVRAERPDALQVTKVRTMFNYATNSLVYDGLRVRADHVIGTVDDGFRYVIDGWNAQYSSLLLQGSWSFLAGLDRLDQVRGCS